MRGELLFESRVHGLPRPQGTLNVFGYSKTGKPMVSNPKQLLVWRQTCIDAFEKSMAGMRDFEKIESAVHLDLTFWFTRPQVHFKSDKKTLKDTAPKFHAKAPDLDKLQRAIGDALTYGQVWNDDSLCASTTAEKLYVSNPADMGVRVRIYSL